MKTVKVTLKNYRCFEDSAPLMLEVGSGITALVGPNNAGKSAALKFFYEMRPILGQLTNPSFMQSWMNGGRPAITALGVDDQAEIFCNTNDRPLEICLEFEQS